MADTRVQCTSQAQYRLREAGLLTIGDISEADGQFKPWASLQVNHEDNIAHQAFNTLAGTLVANNRHLDPFGPQVGPHRLYFGEESSEFDGRIWMYDVQQQTLPSQWQAIQDSSLDPHLHILVPFRGLHEAALLAALECCSSPSNSSWTLQQTGC